MGSAILAHCAARGMRVLGLERLGPAHARGASWGRSRIIRQAYFEGAAYVPLLRRAYALWEALQDRSGRTLIVRTGGVFAGMPGHAVVAGTLESARAHGLPHTVFDSADLRRRYPQFRPRRGEIAVFEPVAGVLFPERCTLTHLETAIEDGAQAHFGTTVLGWKTSGNRVTVATPDEALVARRLVIAAGPWLPHLVGVLNGAVRVERNVQLWFSPAAPDEVRPDRLPIFAVERSEWPFMLYGFPDFGDGVKCAFHHSGKFQDPDRLDRTIADEDVEPVHEALRSWLPAANGALRDGAACMYALTSDDNFIVGMHPDTPLVILAGGFSGHGFKFCPVVGEIVADLVTEGATAHDIRMFSPRRFTTSAVS